jgi:TM2 domain-containing membrane protein YozV
MALSTEQQMLIEQRLSNDKKSIVVAYILWFFLGLLGAHRFYLGRAGTAVAQLALFLLGLVLAAVVVGLFLIAAVAIWVVVDAFLIPGMIEQHTAELRRRLSGELDHGGR